MRFSRRKRVGMVFVVIVNQGKAPVAVTFVQGNGGGVVDPHLQTQVRAIVFQGAWLRCVAAVACPDPLPRASTAIAMEYSRASDVPR